MLLIPTGTYTLKNHGLFISSSKIGLDCLIFELLLRSKQNIQHAFLHVHSSMEELGRRFPLISKIILNNADNKSLTSFRKASRENRNFLDNERFYWIKHINKYSANFEEFKDSWKKVVNKTPVEFLKNLTFDVQSFLKTISGEFVKKQQCKKATRV